MTADEYIFENVFSIITNNKHAPFKTFGENEPKSWLTKEVKI